MCQTPSAENLHAAKTKRRRPKSHVAAMKMGRTLDRSGTDGFIVVAVLWILGGLAILASIYSIYVIDAAARLEFNNDRVQARALIKASLELTAYHFDGTEDHDRPTRGSFTFRLGPASIGVNFVSEAARIDLNAAPVSLLSGLFSALGATPERADYYAHRVVAWRARSSAQASDLDAESVAYRAAGLHYLPREAPFTSVEELWLVFGIPPSLVKSAMPYVTVFSGLSSVDIFDAPPTVIAALPGMSADRLYAVLQQRRYRPDDLSSLLGLLGQAGSAASGKSSTAIRVTVHVDFDNGRRVDAEAVILPLKKGDEPYRILSWNDDFDGPIN
jgi:general secretion pathway protein K